MFNVGMPTTGMRTAMASPLATARPMRRLVNEPGPSATAMPSRSAGLILQRVNNSFSAGATYCVIHTTTEGAKRLVLPAPADVMELTTGRELGKGIGVIEERLPAGVTRIYRTLREGQ